MNDKLRDYQRLPRRARTGRCQVLSPQGVPTRPDLYAKVAEALRNIVDDEIEREALSALEELAQGEHAYPMRYECNCVGEEVAGACATLRRAIAERMNPNLKESR